MYVTLEGCGNGQSVEGRRWAWEKNLRKGVVRSEGRIAQNSLLRVISRKLTVTSRQNPFVCGRRTRSCIVVEKLLIRKEQRRNKRKSCHKEQRWNPSPEGREKAPQCGRRRRKVDVKLLVGSLVCAFVVLLFWRRRTRSRRRTELLVVLYWFVKCLK